MRGGAKGSQLIYPNPMRTRLTAVSAMVLAVLMTTLLAFPGPQAAGERAAQAARLPTFEVASVKPNKTSDGRGGFSPRTDRYVRTGVTAGDLIRSAYGRRAFESVQLVQGPGWLDTDRFDVTAKIENGAGSIEELYLPDGKGSPGRAYLMVRALLEDRFKLAVHRETREMPIYTLTLARNDGRLGPKLARSDVDCDKAMAEMADALKRTGRPPQRTPGQPPPCTVGGPPGTLEGNDITMQMLADVLTASVNRAVSTPVTRVVVDRTGLTGYFKFKLEWRPDEAPSDAPGVSIFTALQEQLGLKLEPARGPVDVIVIDHVELPTPD